MAQAPWTFAKTYVDFAPHEYTLTDKGDRALFVDAVELIFAEGVRQAFFSYNHQYLIRNGWRYWSMDSTAEHTTLVNRARDYSEAYDSIAEGYDAFFANPGSERPFRKLAMMIEPVAQKGTVLDLGCGTGWLLDWRKVCAEYLGVDPSTGMLRRLSTKHPSAKVIHGSVFEPWQQSLRPNLITALRGTLSYMSIAEVQAVSALMSRNTKFLLMAYGHGNGDPILNASGIEGVVGNRTFTDLQAGKIRERFPAEVIDWHGYTILTNCALSEEFPESLCVESRENPDEERPARTEAIPIRTGGGS